MNIFEVREQIEDLNKLLILYKRNLRALERNVAKFGLYTPSHVVIDMEEVSEKIRGCEYELSNLILQEQEFVLREKIKQEGILKNIIQRRKDMIRERNEHYERMRDKESNYQREMNIISNNRDNEYKERISVDPPIYRGFTIEGFVFFLFSYGLALGIVSIFINNALILLFTPILAYITASTTNS
jgi:hypothetical protein